MANGSLLKTATRLMFEEGRRVTGENQLIRKLVFLGDTFELWQARMIAHLVGMLEGVFPDIDNDLLRLRSYIAPGKSDVDYDKECADLAARLGCHTILYGHTHKRHIRYIDDVTVINAGTWTGDHTDYVELKDGILTVNS